MTNSQPSQGQLSALMFTDIVGSVALQEKLGTEEYTRAVDLHDQIFRRCLDEVGESMILNETGDGFLVSFATPTNAVRAALLFQHYLQIAREDEGSPVAVRIGLHLGVITKMRDGVRGENRAVGMPINITARIMDLGDADQILMTGTVYDDARHHVKKHPATDGDAESPDLQWIAHGLYAFKGSGEPMSIFEVGVAGTAPLTAPPASIKAWPFGHDPAQDDGHGESPAPAELALPPEDLKHSDVFIAYAPVDDKPLGPGKLGWISQFHDNLEVRLEQLSGEPVKIWRATGAASSDPSAEILQNLPCAKTMVSILSPPFLKSPGCLREVDEFWRGAERSGNLRVSDKTRIIKAVKTPVLPGVASHEMEHRLSQMAGFEFFETDPDTGRLWEYDETFGERAKQRYFERVYDLAYEIRDVLQAFGTGAPSGAASKDGRIVYLAEVTSDLLPERDKLKRELLERGHRVVPELPLPLTGHEFENQVRMLLEDSDFAVHLVGDRYGMVPEDKECSVVELQNRLAAKRCADSKLERLIWMPRDVTPRDDRQAAFIQLLVEDPGAHLGGEVVQDSMENFKHMLLDKLAPAPEGESQAGDAAAEPGDDAPATIYLIYEQGDEEAAEPLEDALFDLGFEVTTPHFEGNEVEAGKVHRHNLLHCDAALVYYGSASKPWVEMKLMDLMRAPGYGRTKELIAKSVYIAPSDDRRKARFRTHLADVIRPEGKEIDPRALEPFTNQLRKGGDA